MPEPVSPIQASPKTLLKATGAAIGIAAATLVLFVLPAEAGIDPTGVGKLLGLTRMAGVEEADEPAAEAPTPAATEQAALEVPTPTKVSIEKATAMRSDEIVVDLAPHSDIEVKAHMLKGDSFVFRWKADGGPVKVDMHGEPADAKGDEFTSYWEESAQDGAQGVFVAPFTGTQGWYWRNKGDVSVKVTLTTTGFYKDIAKKGG